MSNYALLLGTKPGGKRELITSDQPVEIRRKFKDMTAKDGYELVEVVEIHLGRTRHRRFVKAAPAKKAAKKAAKKSAE